MIQHQLKLPSANFMISEPCLDHFLEPLLLGSCLSQMKYTGLLDCLFHYVWPIMNQMTNDWYLLDWAHPINCLVQWIILMAIKVADFLSCALLDQPRQYQRSLSRKITHSQSSACNPLIAVPPRQWVLSENSC